jgi:CheY-specific phosphatase CheX
MENLDNYLIENVKIFGDMFIDSLQNMLGVIFEISEEPKIQKTFEHNPGIVISISIIGTIQGEYIISLDEITAAHLCHYEILNDSPEENKIRRKKELSDICKELLNITVGRVIQNLEKEFNGITYQPAVAIFGEVEYPEIPVGSIELKGVAGTIQCWYQTGKCHLAEKHH